MLSSLGGDVLPPDWEATTDPSLVAVYGREERANFLAIAEAKALQLDGRLRVSAFHPRDTFEIQTDSEGNRKWLMSLPHPMLHVVLASPPT